MTNPTFAPGQAIIVRNVLDGRVRWAAPMRVVRDDGDFVALFLDIGTHYQTEADSEGTQTRDFVHAPGQGVRAPFLLCSTSAGRGPAPARFTSPEQSRPPVGSGPPQPIRPNPC